jgi:hypothetical protein
MPDAEIYMAKDTFVDFSTHGGPMRVNAHATARAGHPIIAANPTMWVPLAVDFEVEAPPDPESELRALRPEAVQLGINVDGRWSPARLRKEIDQAKARQVEMGQ